MAYCSEDKVAVMEIAPFYVYSQLNHLRKYS